MLPALQWLACATGAPELQQDIEFSSPAVTSCLALCTLASALTEISAANEIEQDAQQSPEATCNGPFLSL